ncbi:MAG: hypothetical protein UW41_C0012G0027 [Candidatus Collierbacteria bacterium GW2011_GWC2_44_18]|uniref:Uncharacterized protein n=1 Tax=Candidatus Collierbacteria bacterium GW2011_GWC2_44_18 TaxID=1618392 RepID=A0A0G1KMD1_9BACT|nr:MAG: hypothetical protein UW16_C0031G0035 [Microgenomates group bacterium GW2011_GWC1_44_10]KKT49089.1 MAG: hypothetical protein UW41_C0012G0027 [Candidatus Collierbacteria bacterium GW2011_GWC2_44_18]
MSGEIVVRGACARGRRLLAAVAGEGIEHGRREGIEFDSLVEVRLDGVHGSLEGGGDLRFGVGAGGVGDLEGIFGQFVEAIGFGALFRGGLAHLGQNVASDALEGQDFVDEALENAGHFPLLEEVGDEQQASGGLAQGGGVRGGLGCLLELVGRGVGSVVTCLFGGGGEVIRDFAGRVGFADQVLVCLAHVGNGQVEIEPVGGQKVAGVLYGLRLALKIETIQKVHQVFSSKDG